ncbi:MAG: hypothetical protein LC800_03585, partial [Acidobacteria bacterium]|nr:hypothetical protein [Acidobacteriota bacterium]
MRLKSRAAVLLFAAAFGADAFSQLPSAAPRRQPEKPPAETKTTVPPPATQTPAAEPFDKAGAKLLGEQCVKLETEAGAIELEMLAEAAPETVRNFLN